MKPEVMGLAGFGAFLGALGLVHAGAGRTRADPGHLLVHRQDRLLHVSLHLVPHHFAALPFRSADENGLEGAAPHFDRGGDLTALIGVRQELFALVWR